MARLEVVENLYDEAAVGALSAAQLADSPAFPPPAPLTDIVFWMQMETSLGSSCAAALMSSIQICSCGGVSMQPAPSATSAPRYLPNCPPSFGSCPAFTPTDIHDCAGLADLAALELAILARHHSA